MTAPHLSHYLAIDLGAESGRVMLGTLEDGRLSVEELHRFGNGAVALHGTLRWDLVRLWSETLAGLRKAAERHLEPRSVSVDSWGVDYVLIRGEEPMLGPAYHYRDPRALGPYDSLRQDPGEAWIYERTGIQFMPLNSLYQLVADHKRDLGWVESADGLLMIADWFHWMLSGRRVIEETNASTTQLYDPVRRSWSWELIDRVGLPRKLFQFEVVAPGSELGGLASDVAVETGLDGLPQVVACCTHDTGSAVAAVPAVPGFDWAYLSSGTWSLIGVELAEPLLTEAARKANFTNELGFGNTVRLLRNIIGLWLLQESRRHWASEHRELDYAEITRLAAESEPLRTLIVPDDPRFLAPGDIPARIQAFCRESNQLVPETPGQIARCIFESLALLYAIRLEELEQLTGRTLRTLHIVGGGSRNRLLNQLAADATGRTVIAGPVEATAIGNLLVQAIAMGDVADLAEARAIVLSSFPVETFIPVPDPRWTKARTRFGEVSAKRGS